MKFVLLIRNETICHVYSWTCNWANSADITVFTSLWWNCFLYKYFFQVKNEVFQRQKYNFHNSSNIHVCISIDSICNIYKCSAQLLQKMVIGVFICLDLIYLEFFIKLKQRRSIFCNWILMCFLQARKNCPQKLDAFYGFSLI